MRLMSRDQCNEFKWTMRIAPYYLTAGLAALIISSYWEPLHPDCLAIAFSFGMLTSLFQVFDYRIYNRYCLALFGLFRLGLLITNCALMGLVTRHSDGWPVAIQFMGCFILAYATGILLFGSLFGSRIPNAHGSPTAIKQPDHTI